MFEGLDHFVYATKIASSRDYDLLFCFAKILNMHIMTMFLRQQMDETLRVLVCIVLSFFMLYLSCISQAICLILDICIQTLIFLSCIFESNKCVKVNLQLLQHDYGEGDTSLNRVYLQENKTLSQLLQPNWTHCRNDKLTNI